MKSLFTRKVTGLIGILILAMSLFTSCIGDPEDNDKDQTSTGTIDKKFWGSWIQMDTGDEYYIDSYAVWSSSSYSLKNKEVQVGINGYTMDGTNVLVKGSTRYFRKGGGARSFTLNTSGFTDTAAKAIGLGKQQVTGRRTNKNNDSDKQTIKSEDDGKLKFTEAVAGDEQTVVVTTEPTGEAGTENTNKANKVEIVVTPTYDGENLGTVPLVEPGSYGFKTSYKVATDDPQGFCYGNYAQTYTVTAALTNIGSVDCAASAYTITCEDKNLALSGTLKGNFTTIEHGKSKDITFKVSYGALEKEYVDVPVKVSITDSKYLRTWDDYITLRFYKGLVNLNVKAYSPESKSSAKLKGFLIYPDGRSKNFEVSHNSSKAITVPWSEQDYILAFSGATADSEMRFSCGFVATTELADLTGFWSAEEIGAYNTATSTETAFKIADLKTPIKAYLGKGDVRFFKVNNSGVKLSYSAPVECFDGTFTDSTTLNASNNSDGYANPGEEIYMDFKLYNTTKNAVNGVTCTVASTSKYVTFKTSTANFGNIGANCYKTYFDKVNSSTSIGYTTASSSKYTSTMKATNFPFCFTVSKECPKDETIYITVSFKDSAGKSWSDDTKFKIIIKEAVDPVKFVSYSLSDATSINTGNNGNGILNPGEVVYLDVKLRNQFSIPVSSLSATLSSSSKYVTINTDSRTFGTINGSYYKTYYDAYKSSSSSGYSAESSSLFSSTVNASYFAYKITVATDCPKDEVIKFTLTYKDSLNKTWKEEDVMSFTVGENSYVATGITAVTDTITSDVVSITYTVDSLNNQIKFTATGGNSYVWYLDGKKVVETQIYTLDGTSSSITAGIHEVMVVATKGTTKYSAQKQFTVIKNKTATETGPTIPPSGTVFLKKGVYTKDELVSASSSKKYYFYVTEGKTYSVYWDDSYQGTGNYTCDIKVSGAYDTGSSSSLFSTIRTGYNTPKTFKASKSCYVILTVQPYSTSSKSTGTYAIKYTEQ